MLYYPLNRRLRIVKEVLRIQSINVQKARHLECIRMEAGTGYKRRYMSHPPRYSLRLQVPEADIDLLGHTNNVAYLRYLERAAIEHASALGFDLEHLRELGGFFVVRKHEIEYLRPTIAGDELEILTWVESMEATRTTRRYEIYDAATGLPVVRAATLWIWTDFNGRPRRIPQVMRDAFTTNQASEQKE